MILASLLGVYAIAFPAQFKHQFEISVVRQSTPYTQLFFSNQATLPKKLVVGRANDFSFTVVNDEGHSQTYQYTVTLTATGTKSQSIASQGSLTLADGQSISQAVGVKPASRGSQYLIQISLSGTTDLIQFYGNTPK